VSSSKNNESGSRQGREDVYPTESLAAGGYCFLPDGLTDGQRTALVTEALAHAPSARCASGNYYRVNADGSVCSPRCLSTIAAGPVLRAIHQDKQRLGQLQRIVGRRVSPTRGSYIYYKPGDYIGLHKDASVCQITLITSVAGAPEPLMVHPSLVSMPSEELLAISRAYSGMPPGGTRIAVPRGEMFLMLLGSAIPHHRPATLDCCTIVTLCYA
jgi:hypothetical protein